MKMLTRYNYVQVVIVFGMSMGRAGIHGQAIHKQEKVVTIENHK